MPYPLFRLGDVRRQRLDVKNQTSDICSLPSKVCHLKSAIFQNTKDKPLYEQA